MNALRIALVLGLMAAPAFAQSFDLPRLTWPTQPDAPVTQGCATPAQQGKTVPCPGK